MPAPNATTPVQLARLIGTPEAPVLLDLRIDEDFEADPFLIPTATRLPFEAVETHAPSLVGRKVVVICHGGLKISQGGAALLRHHGVQAEVLEGGMLAWRALPEAPAIPAAALPPLPSTWVTRHRPKIDRIACPWLIRRFIDAEARVLFVPPGDVEGVAQRFGAVPFDIPDVTYGHHGDRCSFDAIMARFGLTSPGLERLARVVRAADTGRHDLAPEAAGLLALSVGLSRQFRDDLEQLEAGMGIYDALYRWARDGQGETHDHGPSDGGAPQ